MFLGILRYSSRGRGCIIYQHPNSPKECSVFFKRKSISGREVATCIMCNGIFRLLSSSEKDKSNRPLTMMVLNGDGFRSDPLSAPHLPGCTPSLFRPVMEKFNAVSKSISVNTELTSPCKCEREIENKASAKEDKEGAVNLFPVDVCMAAVNPKRPMFLCRIAPGSTSCYKFLCAKGRGLRRDSTFRVVCSGCMFVSERERKKSGRIISLSYKTTDGYNLLSDPTTNHVPDCTVHDYDVLIKKSPMVTDVVKGKIINGEDISMHLHPHGSPFRKSLESEPLEDYLVEIAMNSKNPKYPVFIYRLKDDQKQCYKFHCRPKNKTARHHLLRLNGNFDTRCACCKLISEKQRRESGKSAYLLDRQTDGVRMMSDPLSGHLAGCKPSDYQKTVHTSSLVSEAVRDKIIQGADFSMHLPPSGSPFPVVEEADDSCGDEKLKVDSTVSSRRTRYRKRLRVK